MVTGRTAHRVLAALAALAVVALTPGAVATAAEPPAYRPAESAKAAEGTPSAADAPQITPGLYTDAIGRGETNYYAVTLDAKSSAYFSAVAAPAPGTKVEDSGDRLTVSVQDSSGNTCSTDATPTFHGGDTAYPIADYASRRIGTDRTQCQEAGLYYLVISREGSATSGPDSWPIEVGYLSEPALKGSTPGQPGEGSWPTVTPAPPTAAGKRAAKGGTGFNDAGSVGTGVWKDRILPGETRFYQVPVDWGQQLNLRAELPNAKTGATEYVPDALGLGVHNPARGAVSDDNFVPYDGKPAVAKEFTAPVAYGNRFHTTDEISAMRFAGWYYLEVTLHPDVAQFFPKGADLTLRVDVRGTPKPGPGYAGPAGDFSVTPEEREMADKGQSEQEAAKSDTLRTVAYAGIGVGVVLLTCLAAWTVVARRRATASGAPDAGSAALPGAGPQAQADGSWPGQQGQQLPRQGGRTPQDQPGGRTPRDGQFGPPRGW